MVSCDDLVFDVADDVDEAPDELDIDNAWSYAIISCGGGSIVSLALIGSCSIITSS